MQILSPPRLITTIDIADRATSISHIENHAHGALVSIDLDCSEGLFYRHRELAVRFSLSFTTQSQDGFHRSVAIQYANAAYFPPDNDLEKMIDRSTTSQPHEKDQKTFKDGKAEFEMQQPQDSSSVRIVVLLDAYPSNMEVSASLFTSPAADGVSRSSRAFMSASRPSIASSPDDERLQRLLCWTAALGHRALFAAYFDQGPSILDVEDEFGMTPFSWAALSGQQTIIQLALQQGGSISSRQKTTKSPSPLEAAARCRDKQIFHNFLKFLKYAQTKDDEIPAPDGLPHLDNEEVKRELNLAVRGEQMLTIQRLVEILRDRQQASLRGEWLDERMEQAARDGALCLVQVLKILGAKIDAKVKVKVEGEANSDMDYEDEQTTTPLVSAITCNRTNVAQFLIIHGAGDEEALRTAVEKRQHSTIQALLQVGVVLKGGLRNELLETAARKKDSTTLMLLKLEKGTGKLATYNDLEPKIDELFEATVVQFCEDRGPRFQELTVNKLMHKGADFFEVSGETTFKWFHLPANNMKWAEALIGKIYHEDPSSAYKVLDPKRWAKIQHEGEIGSAHARFMIPACHDFSEAFKHNKSEKPGSPKEDKNVLLFMPYLHWDEEKAMRERTTLISQNSPTQRWDEIPREQHKSKRDELLLTRYLFDEVRLDLGSCHVLYVRRTLDQPLYHNLKDTRTRDADQAVQRYQKKRGITEPMAVVMVDQLWLWILAGPSGKADRAVTCFPSRDWHDVGMATPEHTQPNSILDRRRTTDVLQITKSYLQQRSNAVKSAYDLAGVIASRCSRALLDHSSDMLNFAEVYENSISTIMNEEAVLFQTFNTLMQTRTKMDKSDDGPELLENPTLERADSSFKSLPSKIMNDLTSLGQLRDQISLEKSEPQPPDFATLEQHCKEYRRLTLDTEIPDDNELKRVNKMTGKTKIEHLINLIEKFGRFYVLDITREITLLRQIKDIQDELGMMEKIFAEQKDVLDSMDRIIRLMAQQHVDPAQNVQTGKPNTRPAYARVSNGSNVERDLTGDRHALLRGRVRYAFDGDSDYPVHESQSAFYYRASPGAEFQNRSQSARQMESMIWGYGQQRQNLPLRTVARYSKLIQKMSKRAEATNSALNTLVDLKQKQNNMIDTRTARLQAEQSHLMTLEAEKQGRTLMVFTIVTIVFLPLSFIAAFFAIPAKEFGNNTLTLGYVSKIIFPLSAAISLVFISIGFLASKWRPERIKNIWAGAV